MADGPEADDLARRYADAIAEGRHDEAVARLESSGDVTGAAVAIAPAVQALFRRHDLTGMLAAAELGVTWCVARASGEATAEGARELRQRAQAAAFNAAANCWPGWDDAGIVILDEHIARGLALAVRSRELVLALGFGADRVGTAHWLVGALELAAGRPTSAQAAFVQSASAFDSAQAGSPEGLMAQGYLALARSLDVDARDDATRDLAATIERLRSHGSRKGSFFADQIATAARVFAARRPTGAR
jgi:hypothetical protein